MKASEMIAQLVALVKEHGDKDVWHEDNECQGYSLSRVEYCETDDDFQVH